MSIEATSTHFQQHIDVVPQLESPYWSFMLGGLVDLPFFLSYADLLTLPSVECDVVVACAGNSPGGSAIGQARWHGVPMMNILAEVQVQPGARYAHLHAADGYSTCISIDVLQHAMLAYTMNGEALPTAHGFPARLIVPRLYGYKMPKWIQRVILAETPLPGFWEQRGWSLDGKLSTAAAFTSPADLSRISGRTRLQGYAYGDVAAVELSINSGPWMPAAFEQPSPDAMAQWAIDWTAPATGTYRLSVRARDDAGQAQPDPLHSILLYVN